MTLQAALIGICALVISACVTGIVRRFALSHGVLDVPNARSSHSQPTPRGGGVSVVVAFTLASIALALLGRLQIELLIALLGGGTAVALVGFLDDRFTVSAGARLLIHVAAAVWALAWLGGMPPLRIGDRIVQLGWIGHLLAVFGLVWVLNLFNFMDGIDAIAGSEAVFIACVGALLTVVGGGSGEVSALGLAFGGACCGFLLWNWPPARIFLGDVGSGYIGYVIAVLALAAARKDPAALWVWLILGSTFFVDATVTLVRRMLRGERVHEAHRSHAYQWLALRWRSHLRVTLAFLALNLLWLAPCAALATIYPPRAAWMACLALTPLTVLAVISGAGRRGVL